MLLIGIAAAAFCATLAGGWFALRLKDNLHLVLGFSAGAVVAVSFFDLLPEAMSLGLPFYSPAVLMSFTALGFLLYLVLDRVQLLHGAHDHGHDHDHDHGHDHSKNVRPVRRGALGAGSLVAHSFLDGISIGLAFQTSQPAGVIVAVAVVAHDFSDGINTMSVVLKDGGNRRQGLRWLLMDALAPIAGVASTLLFTLPEKGFGLVLALFAGFFLYIGASDLIPESHHAHPKFLTTVMTLLGAGALYVIITLVGR
ncbi:MAG: ZIP family metal transporter [Gammaproteobacteria bacterium]